MKFILASAILATAAYGTASPAVRDYDTTMYLRLNFHCPPDSTMDGTAIPDTSSSCVVNTNSAAGGGVLAEMTSEACIDATIFSQFIVRAPYNRGGTAGVHLGNANNGSCINMIDGATTTRPYDFGYGAVHTKSISFERHDTSDLVTVYKWSTPGCVGTVANTATGFFFNDASVQGKSLCGGNVDGTLEAVTDWGLDIGATTRTDVAVFSASRWSTKKSFAGQVIGPFAAACKTYAAFGNTSIFVPVVIPLEDAAVASPATAKYYSEFAIGDTDRCWNINSAANGETANEAEYYAVRTGSAGEFVFTFSHGTAAKREYSGSTGAVTCTKGATVFEVTYKMDYGGMADLCVEAKNAAGTASGSYFLLKPAVDNFLGAWPGSESIPVSAGGTACAPASGLHFSAMVAALIAFVNMLM